MYGQLMRPLQFDAPSPMPSLAYTASYVKTKAHFPALMSGVFRSVDGELIGMMGQNSQYGRKGWYSTLADSLLAVNGRDQIVGRGRLVRLEQNEDWAAVEIATAPATPLYEPTVDYHRLVVSGPDFVLLLDRATALEPVAFHWAFYPGQDTRVPDGWKPAEHPGLHPGEKQNGPLSPVRKDWLAAPRPGERLAVPAEVRDEPNPTPVTILSAPAQQPYAFSTPGNQKGGWIHALLLHGAELTGAVWAAVLDRSAEKSVRAELISASDAKGKPLPVGRAAAVRLTAPRGTWTPAVGPAQAPVKAGGHTLAKGWLIRRESVPPPP